LFGLTLTPGVRAVEQIVGSAAVEKVVTRAHVKRFYKLIQGDDRYDPGGGWGFEPAVLNRDERGIEHR
jgi:hypothetical protein